MISINLLHPVSSFLYFVSILCITMFTNNPFILLISFFGGVIFLLCQKCYFSKGEILGFIIMSILITATNPLFVHRGETVLFFFNNNPVTAESLFFGANLSLMLISTIMWFKSLNLVLTDDKILAIFGKLSPKFATIISLVLRFIPMLKRQAKKIKDAQIVAGLYKTDTFVDKIKSTVRVYSSLLTYCFENAITIGNSMKSRGYGSKKIKYFNFYSWKISDTIFIVSLIIIDILIAFMSCGGYIKFSFYPVIKYESTVIPYILFLCLSLYPSIIEIKESLKWKYYIQKI